MNGNEQQAYDRGTSLFSPDGRIYQVEYAREAVSRGAPSVGVRTADGVVLAARTRARSSLMVEESIEKLHKVDEHVGAASAGHVADARRLVDFARRQAQVNRLRYGQPIDVETLTKAITDHVQESTQRGGTRPFGAALLIGGMDGDRPRLFEADPSGTPQEWKAAAIGGDRQAVQSFFEEEYAGGEGAAAEPPEEFDLDAGIRLALRGLLVDADDLEPEAVSVATVSADGFDHLDAAGIEGYLDEVSVEGE